MFGGYGPDIDHYLHGVGEFFWDSVSKWQCAFFCVQIVVCDVQVI